jgi:hypothetical protein
MKKENEKVIEKVRKALALARDNPNDHEAETAMLLAQRLLAKNGMSMNDVEDSEGDKLDRIMEMHITERSGRIPWWKKSLAYTIAENFKCKSLITRFGNSNSSLTFFGLEEDVLVAVEVYQYAEMVIDKLAKSYVGKIYRSGESTKGVRNDFIYGFLTGLNDKFKEQVETNEWGLVLSMDALVVKTFSEKKMRKSSSSGIRPEFAGDSRAHDAGYKEGENFADTSSRRGITE